MASEKQLRSNVVKALRAAGLDGRPVENPIDPGFPDVEYVGGLIELKEVSGWPARASTPLRVDCYTQEQRVWHRRRSSAGGRVHLLLQVGREFLLFRGADAAAAIGSSTESHLRSLAVLQSPNLSDLRLRLVEALQADGQAGLSQGN